MHLHIYMIIHTVPRGSSSSLVLVPSYFLDKVYRDKMASDLWVACVLCTEESVREALRRAIGANWAYNSLSP